MTPWRLACAAAIFVAAIGRPDPVRAQEAELAPYFGYRFGGDFFEIAAQHPVDADGGPAVGFVLNIPLHEGLQVEGLFTHQKGPSHTAVDHWLAGGLQEFGRGRVRPFTTGMLGLTRYAFEAEQEVRFTVSAGGGMKAFPVSWLGLRLDGRVFTTFVDAEGRFGACSSGRGCAISLDVDVVWQAEFTAGLTVRLP